MEPPGDLCVSFDALEDSERDLKTIKSEFENCSKHTDELRAVWGSGEVADAMGEFVGNWDYHRKDVLDSIQAVGDMVSGTLQTFRETDQKLADQCKGD